ncbi:Serpin B6 [Bulinus truncatus]|nr:Serpin B6 [Bulinus truncatus]
MSYYAYFKMSCGALLLVFVGQLVKADQELSLSSASSDFSQRLYQEIARDKSNVIYSPYSIHSVLTMTSLGARGETLTEMRTTLGISSLGDEVHGMYRELIQKLNSDSITEIHTGNVIFVKSNHTVEPKFINDTWHYYFAKTDNIDMSGDWGLEKPINDFIANQTENMIKDILELGAIDNSTVMLLINTIFFNGQWEREFNKSLTRSQNFELLGGQAKQVDMMHDTKAIQIKRDYSNCVDIAVLPFRGGRFSLYIVLPQKVDGISDVEKLLTQPVKVQRMFTGFNYGKVQLAVPKFKTESTINLNGALKNLGIVKAFQPTADFSDIINKDQLYITDAVHKAVIDVQESGTVATAATSVSMGVRSSASGKDEGTFIADHPFIYFLRDVESGQILFQGKFSG